MVSIALLDCIANMNANAEFDVALRGKPGIALHRAVLHLDGATHCATTMRNSTIAPSSVRFTTRPW